MLHLIQNEIYSKDQIIAFSGKNYDNNFIHQINKYLKSKHYQLQYVVGGNYKVINSPADDYQYLDFLLCHYYHFGKSFYKSTCSEEENQNLVYNVALFIYFLQNYDNFQSMPWKTRHSILMQYGFDCCERTLSYWYSKLATSGVVAKSAEEFYWMSYVDEHNIKQQIRVQNEAELMAAKDQYRAIFDRLQKVDEDQNNIEYGNKCCLMWGEYKVCFYKTRRTRLSAWQENTDAETLKEMLECVNRIVHNRIGKDYNYKIECNEAEYTEQASLQEIVNHLNLGVDFYNNLDQK